MCNGPAFAEGYRGPMTRNVRFNEMKRAIRRILILTLVGGITGCAAEHNSTVSQRLGPYSQTGSLLDALTYDDAEHAHWKQKYKSLSREEQILYCIEQLVNEQYHEHQVSGELPDTPYTTDPEASPRAELTKIGKNAIPHLIAALDRKEATGIVPSRHCRSPWLVRDAALDVIQGIVCREFFLVIKGGSPERPHVGPLSDDEHNMLRTTIQTWWETNRNTDEVN